MLSVFLGVSLILVQESPGGETRLLSLMKGIQGLTFSPSGLHSRLSKCMSGQIGDKTVHMRNQGRAAGTGSEARPQGSRFILCKMEIAIVPTTENCCGAFTWKVLVTNSVTHYLRSCVPMFGGRQKAVEGDGELEELAKWFRSYMKGAFVASDQFWISSAPRLDEGTFYFHLEQSEFFVPWPSPEGKAALISPWFLSLPASPSPLEDSD